jgi:hypothetical protein
MRRSGWGRDACHRSLRKVIVRALWEPLCSRDALHAAMDFILVEWYHRGRGSYGLYIQQQIRTCLRATIRTMAALTRGGTRCGGLGHSAHSLARGSSGKHQVTR